VVMPAGGGLVPPAAPDQRNAHATRARLMSPAAHWLARRVSRAVSATDSLIRAIGCGRPNLGSGGWGRPGIVAGNDHEVAQLSGAGFPASRFFVQEIRVGMSGEPASTRPTWSRPG
jgi:hypothetical protein